MKTAPALILLLLFSLPSFATISDLEVFGASVYDDESGNTPVVYAGVAGSSASCSNASSTDTCNNCTTAKSVCNETRITDDQFITFTFKSTEEGTPQVVYDGSVVPSTTTSGNTTVGNEASITILWQQMCNSLSDTFSTCALGADGLITGTVSVGIADPDTTASFKDSSNVNVRVYESITTNTTTNNCANSDEEGLCSFTIQPGDQQVYLDDNSLTVAEFFPTINNDITVDKIRIMFSSLSWDDTNPSGNYQDIDVINEDEISGDAIDGLDNDVPYVFSFASVDVTGNVAYFMDQTLFESSCPGILASTDISTLGDAVLATCPYIGIPGEVIGLLKDDLNCFIATATYGTHMHSHIQKLREFRNIYLLGSSLGKRLVKYYYKWGSRLSHWIRGSDAARWVSYLVISPAVAFAYLTVDFGFFLGSLLFTLLGGLLCFGVIVSLKGTYSIAFRKKVPGS